ncbi:Microfibrillar-associated protein 1-like [Heracleum sosnowskyi]|uniref:Microfibrillar-associated protein 1-like n=1 Tax=Heracleum sosnowskyi TaxID=360622 RepID=A0AAD8MCI3_9APIA|nr:Microfibrillar-associated protein 1-like [Heracleum sosnowskyi]
MDNPEDIRADHRRLRKAESVSTIEEGNTRRERLDLEEEEDALVERRKRIRENVLRRQQEEEEEEESEYDTDSDEQSGIAMLIPVFVIKSERDTVAECERLDAEDRVLEDLTKERIKKRKIETKQIVAEEILKDEQIQKNIKLAPDIADVNMNEAEDYETWQVREIARIKRDRDNREAMSKDKEEIVKIRNMIEEERREWERKNPKPAAPAKQKWTCLQMYYHKGAFYHTDSDDR